MRKLGYTQVELLTAVAILGVLATISVPRLMPKSQDVKATVCNSNVIIINKAIDLKFASRNSQPNLWDVVNDRGIFPDGPPQCPFGKRYVIGSYGHILPHNHAADKPLTVP